MGVRSHSLLALVALAVVAGLPIVGAVAADADVADVDLGADCGSKAYRVLFWPDGNKAIPSAGIPAFNDAHAEIYSGSGNGYTDSTHVAYSDPTGSGVKLTCTKSKTGQFLGVEHKKVVRSATKLTCTYPNRPGVDTAHQGVSPALVILFEGHTTAIAIISPSDPTLTYNTKYCKKGKLPH